MTRVLVCGDRNWTDRDKLFVYLDYFHKQHAFSVVIEGEANGADQLARVWAQLRAIPVLRFPANWGLYGRAAGPMRNQQMLKEGRPTLVIAFHSDLASSRGTAHMVSLAKQHHIPIEVVK